MAYNFPSTCTICPLCSNFHSAHSHLNCTQGQGLPQGQPQGQTLPPFCCHSQCCACCQYQHLYPYAYAEGQDKVKLPAGGGGNKTAPRKKLQRSQSSLCAGHHHPHHHHNQQQQLEEQCAKGKQQSLPPPPPSQHYSRPRRRQRAASPPPPPTPHKCCSSSTGAAAHHGAQERRRRQSQPRHQPAPSCDINRLMSMVRDPARFYPPRPTSTSPCTSTSSRSSSKSTSRSSSATSIRGRQLSLPSPTDTNTEIPLDTNHLDLGQTLAQGQVEGQQQYNNMQTRVRFMPPSSCFMLVKKADQQRLVKMDRQVQCCFDISSDFCSCSKAVCECCAKKVVCTCARIRCCMCAKLKSTADRRAHALAVCRCPKMFKCCEMATSFLRFNSSPALTAGRSPGSECAAAVGRPITL